MKYFDFPNPKQHVPFFVGEYIQMIRHQRIIATVLSVSSKKSSITGAWYEIEFHRASGGTKEFISGHEWRRKTV